MKRRAGEPWMSADEYGRSLRGLTINLLVRDIEPPLHSRARSWGPSRFIRTPTSRCSVMAPRSGCSTPTTPIETTRSTEASQRTARAESGPRYGCMMRTPMRPRRRRGGARTRFWRAQWTNRTAYARCSFSTRTDTCGQSTGRLTHPPEQDAGNRRFQRTWRSWRCPSGENLVEGVPASAAMQAGSSAGLSGELSCPA